MGKCKYCGMDAGWFSSEHNNCREKHDQGKQKLLSILLECFRRKEDFYLKNSEVNTIISSSFIDPSTKEEVFIEALDSAIEEYLNDGVVDSEEEKTVARYIQFSNIPQDILNRNHSIEKVVQSGILQNLLNGVVPKPQFSISGSFPFLLQKNEELIWIYRNVTFYEQKVKREYVGRSRGVSFRVCKGVYYRTGGFKGHPVETTTMQRISSGIVCLTSKHLYYHSPEKSLKIPYAKIINIESYSNGVGIHKDGVSSKPMFFEGMDSWFTYNVIDNLR